MEILKYFSSKFLVIEYLQYVNPEQIGIIAYPGSYKTLGERTRKIHMKVFDVCHNWKPAKFQRISPETINVTNTRFDWMERDFEALPDRPFTLNINPDLFKISAFLIY